jgi:anti-sigma factor RsiW
MNENHTLQHQLILHVFNELPPSESGSFEHQLISDPELQEEHRAMKNLLQLLRAELSPLPDESSLSPSPAVSYGVLVRLETLMTDQMASQGGS